MPGLYPTAYRSGSAVAMAGGSGFQKFAGPLGAGAVLAQGLVQSLAQQPSSQPGTPGVDYPMPATPAAGNVVSGALGVAQAIAEAASRARPLLGPLARVAGRFVLPLGLALTAWDLYQLAKSLMQDDEYAPPVSTIGFAIPSGWIHVHDCYDYAPNTVIYTSASNPWQPSCLTLQALWPGCETMKPRDTGMHIAYKWAVPGPSVRWASVSTYRREAAAAPARHKVYVPPRSRNPPAWIWPFPAPGGFEALPSAKPIQNGAVRQAANAAASQVIGGSTAGYGSTSRATTFPWYYPGRPSLVPARVWDLNLATGVRVFNAFGSHAKAVAGARTYEKKFRAPALGDYAAMRLFGSVTEFMDLEDALFQSLPVDLRQFYGHEWRGLTPWERAEILWREREHVEWSRAAAYVLLQNASDALIGTAGQIQTVVSKDLGLPMSVQFHGGMPRSWYQ